MTCGRTLPSGRSSLRSEASIDISDAGLLRAPTVPKAIPTPPDRRPPRDGRSSRTSCGRASVVKSRSLPSRPSSASRTEPPTRASENPASWKRRARSSATGAITQQFIHRCGPAPGSGRWGLLRWRWAQQKRVRGSGGPDRRLRLIARSPPTVPAQDRRSGHGARPLYTAHIAGQCGGRPRISWTVLRGTSASPGIVTMRGRTFRRPLIRRGTGEHVAEAGRLPGDAVPHLPAGGCGAPRHPVRRGPAAGGPGPAGPPWPRQHAEEGSRRPGRFRLGLGGRGRRTRSRPAFPAGRHGDGVRHGDQHAASKRSPTPTSACGWAHRWTPVLGSTRRPGQRRSSRRSIAPEVDDKYTQEYAELVPGVARALQHLRAGRRAEPRRRRRLRGRRGSLSGQTAAQPWEQILGVRRTFLPWQPDEVDTRTETTALLWPLVSTIAHGGGDGFQRGSSTPVLRR
ncbi:hypothetical protein SHIRM173S_04584 [Streptomyces hirsutus]